MKILSALNRLLLSLWVIGLVGGCASSPRSRVEPGAVMGPGFSEEVFGPRIPTHQNNEPEGGIDDGTQQGDPSQKAKIQYGPTPRQVKPIVLVLGPGLARGFSYAGLFRALHEAHIPIAAVLGTEMGGLMAVLFGMSGNLNQFEWGLLQVKTEIFISSGGMFASASSDLAPKRGNTRLLDRALAKIFKGRNITSSKIPVRVAIEDQESKEVRILGAGPAVHVTRAAVADPSLFENGASQFLGQRPWIAASASRPFLVSEARALGLGPIVAVNVLPHLNSEASSELGLADLVLEPRLDGIGSYEFKKRNLAALAGKRVVRENLQKLRELTGMGAK